MNRTRPNKRVAVIPTAHELDVSFPASGYAIDQSADFITLSGLPSPQSKDPGAWPRGLVVLRLWSQSVDRSRREAIVDAAADNTVRHATGDVCPERKSGRGRQKD